MFDSRQQSASCDAVAGRPSVMSAWLILRFLQRALEELLGSDTIALSLHLDIQDHPVQVHGAPKAMLHAVQVDKNWADCENAFEAAMSRCSLNITSTSAPERSMAR